eukprot:257178-Prorocentrum_minimum.AAC.1
MTIRARRIVGIVGIVRPPLHAPPILLRHHPFVALGEGVITSPPAFPPLRRVHLLTVLLVLVKELLLLLVELLHSVVHGRYLGALQARGRESAFVRACPVSRWVQHENVKFKTLWGMLCPCLHVLFKCAQAIRDRSMHSLEGRNPICDRRQGWQSRALHFSPAFPPAQHVPWPSPRAPISRASLVAAYFPV